MQWIFGWQEAKKRMKNLNIINNNLQSLYDEALDAFFDLKAEFVYFDSITRVHPRLDCHPYLIPAFVRWFHVSTSMRYEIIDEFILKRKETVQDDFINLENILWDRADEFFPSESRASLEMLKKARINAAKKLHPDIGGSNEQMQLLNNTYDLLQDIALNKKISDNTEHSDPYKENPIGYRQCFISDIPGMGIYETDIFYNKADVYDELIAAKYFSLLVAEWNLDTAVNFFKGGSIFNNMFKREEGFSYTEPKVTLERLVKLSFRLNRADILQSLKVLYKEKWFLNYLENITDRDYKFIPIKMDHPRRTFNIQRLSNQKIKPKDTVNNNIERKERLQRIKFSKLYFDPPIKERPVDATRIPYPRGKIEDYASEQIWEYHQTFYKLKDWKLIEKHLYARTDLVLRTLIHPESNPRLLLKEIEELTSIFSNKNWMLRLKKFYCFMKNINEDKQRERLDLLFCLQEKYKYTDDFIISFSYEYLDLAELPIDVLQRAIQVGDIKTKKEKKEEKQSWKAIEQFLKKNDPYQNNIFEWESEELKIKCISGYIDSCLNFSKKNLHVEEFQICYWYDLLTIALVKQKKWQDAKNRLDQMFNLPDRFFDRSCKSEKERLQKRSVRCNRMIGC